MRHVAFVFSGLAGLQAEAEFECGHYLLSKGSYVLLRRAEEKSERKSKPTPTQTVR